MGQAWRCLPGFVSLCLVIQPGNVSADLSPGDHLNSTLEVDGETRLYDVHVPPGYDGSSPVPLVLDLHSRPGNKTLQATISGFKPLSDAEGFIVAYPQGLFGDPNDPEASTGQLFVDPIETIGPGWNAGEGCCNPAAIAGVDDVGFLLALVNTIAGEANIDPRRVYATGFSGGGSMAHHLACEAAHVFAAVAPIASPLLRFGPDFSSSLSTCQPSRAIPVLHFAGIDDIVFPFEGCSPEATPCAIAATSSTPGVARFPSALDSFTHWRSVNGCGSDPNDPLEEVVVEGPTSMCETDTSCADDVQVGLCSIDGIDFGNVNGHVLYLNEDGLLLAPIAWDFLSQFELPAAPRALTKDEQKCINSLNHNFAKVAKAQGKDICDCIKDFAKGKSLTPASTLEGCLIADRKGKVAGAEGKTGSDATKNCGGPSPLFGATDASTVNSVAVQKELDLIHDIFGPNLDTAILPASGATRDTSKCQQAVARAVKKCQDAKLKEFNKCKKLGLKSETTTGSLGLQGCMGQDPKGKIAKACDPTTGKIKRSIDKKCGGVDFPGAFPEVVAIPGCGTNDPAILAACLDQIVECQVCLALNQADNLAQDCDEFDDGVVNGSCP